MTMLETLRKSLFSSWSRGQRSPQDGPGGRLVPVRVSAAGAVSAVVDDSPGWSRASDHPHDYDQSQVYGDVLTAWRKNPLAWRIISITTDYVVGSRIHLTSPRRDLQRFIETFWNHPQNRLDLRLEAMSDELARAGDLFILLFRNPQDGMSYIRFVTKDRITKIETAENDWETELAYHELPSFGFPSSLVPRDGPGNGRGLVPSRGVGGEGVSPQHSEGGVSPQHSEGGLVWLSPAHPQAAAAEAVMLHYAVNRPLGALLGESDLVTMLPWLQRYSRLLEDRVRLNWAMRAFLWVVTVPANKVREKAEQYRSAPEAGSVIVKDESESWQPVAPLLHASDAQADLRAVRQMIDAGSGYPPHWRGEPFDTNVATAFAMQQPTEKHLARRQQYFIFMLQDLLYQTYRRAAEIGKARPLREGSYRELFHVEAPEITRDDNERLATSAAQLSGALSTLCSTLQQTRSVTLRKSILQLVLRFAGAAVDENFAAQVMTELANRGSDE